MIYLTKYMIGDYFAEQNIPVKICGKEPWKFFDVSCDMDAGWDPTRLYFLGTSPFLSAPVCQMRILTPEEFDTYESETEEIICCAPPEATYKTLLTCFSFYKNWYLTLQECLLKGDRLQDLVDRSIPIFKNPIAVSDIGFQVLAYTREYHRQMEDGESCFIVKNGCHSPEYIRLITQHTAFIENLKRNLGPFRYHYDFLQHESIYCTIWLHGKPVGFLTIVGKNPLHYKSHIDAARIFSEILSRAFLQNSAGGIPLSPSDRVLLRILKGGEPDNPLNQDALTDSQLSKTASYSIIHIRMPVIRPSQILLFQKIYDSLSGKLPRSKLLPDDNGITVLLSEKDMPPGDIVRSVDFLLVSYPHQIGISYPFQGLSQPEIYYRQAVECSHLQTILPSEHVFSYETCMIYDFLQNSLTDSQKKAAIHPALAKLKATSDSGSNLYLTLRAYLEVHLNGTTAAERLHIHKNTLYYRLHQIEEQTGLSFDTPRLCDCLSLSFYLSDCVSEPKRA